MSVRSDTAGGLRVPSLVRPPAWLVGWWAVGRVVAIATALVREPSVWTLDRKDSHWYLMIARGGYLVIPGRQSDTAFFPLYPILLRALHTVGISWRVAGPLLSNIAFLFGLWLFYLLTRELFSEPFARRAVTYLAIFPLGYVFSLAYPESVVLILLAAAPLAALHRRWWLAAFCAGAAGLARPEGLFLALPLAGIAWQQRPTLTAVRRGAALAAVLAPIAGLASYSLYLGTLLHDPLAWSQAQSSWGRKFRLSGMFRAFAHLPRAVGHQPWLLRDVVFFFLYLALLYAAWRVGTPRTWLVAGAAVVVLPLFTGSFMSIGRFGLMAPSVFWGLAALTPSARSERVTRAVLLLLLIAGTASLAYVFP